MLRVVRDHFAVGLEAVKKVSPALGLVEPNRDAVAQDDDLYVLDLGSNRVPSVRP
jgi:hypothetical protein